MDLSSRRSDESLHESKNGLLEDFRSLYEDTTCHKCGSRRNFLYFSIIPWLISLILVIILGISTTRSRSCIKSDFWRSSEFEETVTKEVPPTLKQVKFNATLKYNEEHKVYRPITQPAYVGLPTPEIDAAWEELIGAVNVFVTPEEEKFIGKGLWLDPETGLHMAQISVFHDLHCVNFIRQSMYLDKYPEINDPTLQTHVEHCMDMIRLSLMCNGDMTFMPIKWSENRGWIKPEFETVHTCRDYDALREWSTKRDAADPEKYPKNAERLRLKGGGK